MRPGRAGPAETRATKDKAEKATLVAFDEVTHPETKLFTLRTDGAPTPERRLDRQHCIPIVSTAA